MCVYFILTLSMYPCMFVIKMNLCLILFLFQILYFIQCNPSNLKCLAYVLSEGYPIDDVLYYYRDALETGDYTTVDQFMKVGMDIEAEISHKTALMIAAENRHLDIVNLLLSYGASLTHSDAIGSLPVMYAVTGRAPTCAELVEALLPDEFDFSTTVNQDRMSFSNLAILNGHQYILQSLFKNL